MELPNFYYDICSDASMLAPYLLQFLCLPGLGIKFGEGAPAVEAEHGVLLSHVAAGQGAQLDVVEFYEVHRVWLAVFHYGLLEEVWKGAGHDLLHMQEPQQRAHALAGGEGNVFHSSAFIINSITVTCRTAVAVVVEPLCKVVDIFHVLGIDKQLLVFLCVQVLVEGHALL